MMHSMEKAEVFILSCFFLIYLVLLMMMTKFFRPSMIVDLDCSIAMAIWLRILFTVCVDITLNADIITHNLE